MLKNLTYYECQIDLVTKDPSNQSINTIFI